MKKVLICAGILMLAAASSANATTCSQRASNCIKNGGSQGVCFAPERMQSCAQTGSYTGPSGKSWEASGAKTIKASVKH
jgi:hypothetical protein